MSDPLTLAALGGVAAGEAVRFLFQQASEVLKAWRARRDEAAERLSVPIVDNDVLDGPLDDADVDAAAVGREQRAMAALTGALAPYAMDIADIEPSDTELAEAAGRLRALLEAAYGRRLSFRGEQRPPTGSRIIVSQRLRQVDGVVIGVDVAAVNPGADVAVSQSADHVAPEGSVTGVRAERIE